MKDLKRFQRVLLHACAYGLFENGMKINEETGAQHPVYFVFARRVSSHQEFELTRLVSAEMVDVHRGSGLPPAHDFVDQPFESLLLLLGREAPLFFVEQVVLFAGRNKAEEVLPPAFRGEWIAL